jgi:long-subunit fatty acid transport protein
MASTPSFRFIFVLSSLSTLLYAGAASASTVLEVGEAGSEQMQRGGAWIARASDPIAVFYNPAGLAGQPTRLSLEGNVIFQHTCMTRVLAANDSTSEASAQNNPDGTPNGLFPRVCSDIRPFVNPQLAFNYRVTERLGIGIAVLGPNATTAKWPEFTPDGAPAPQRYLLLRSTGLQLTPTIGLGYEVADGLRLGASFQWGIANLHLRNATTALNADNANPQVNDVRALIQMKDYFIPGFTLGALYSVLDELDIAAWYKWSAPIDASGDLVADSNYFTRAGANGDFSGTKGTDTSAEDCGFGVATKVCKSGKNMSVHAVIPMEAKLGFRYHKPKGAEVKTSHVRDPMSQDEFDTELDFTWANNSALDTFRVRFPGNENGDGIIPVNGIAGGTVPPNADITKGFKDVFGVRLGGDYNVIPDQLAVRAGVFAETNGQNQQYQNIDFAGAARFGFAFGGTYRVRLGGEENSNALEFKIGYGHIFFAKQDQGAQDRNAPGLAGIAGVACNPAGNNPASPSQPNTCTDGRDKYRSNWPVNLGTIWNSVNTINVGVAYRF